MLEIKATKNDSGRTLFKLVTKYCSSLPLSRIEKIFRKNDIKVNNIRKVPKNYLVKENDNIQIYGILESEANFKIDSVQKIAQQFKILYEDDNLLIIDKPIGIEVHGADNSIDNQVLSYLNFQAQDSFKPSHIGRLDKDTSGIMLYGKNHFTVSQLNEKSDSLIKKYIFWSNINLDKYSEKSPLKVSVYMLKDEVNKRMKVSPKQLPNSKNSITLFYMEDGKKIAQLLTGRKHQIRATLKYLGYPIAGDKKYHGTNSKRLYLHSYSIKFKNLMGELKYLNNLEIISLPNFKK
ncbi:RluA family pseudouridine synthase [Mycoplasmopsis verecunda]|uniref:RNA pseudouridylate synthase n=1 Tax=Mycoplasmopsis verecunda TaxID=171291 RepID=A0A1T4KQU7_9BACT|nr:RluA family pseudouridine synthase [Mycoplasmopsis verecunda]WPB54696.1 RluA family pseudouridine synthase [Mycoplasmopsis verecunda]SJZ44763.1 23S rRNA pseudouridine955/2504/2580 synthase [Mycoplasmopsis verecunda]